MQWWEQEVDGDGADREQNGVGERNIALLSMTMPGVEGRPLCLPRAGHS